jgi:enoyl-CoA hydratase
MDGLIATYPKPVVALTHGIVMGGGIGIAGHAAFRFTAAESRFAMPEGAIGFFADVGVTSILAQAPPSRALLFLMSGLSVGPADALELGLTDCAVALDRFGAIRAGVEAAASAPHVETALVNLMRAEALPPGESLFTAHAGRLDPYLVTDSAAAIVASVAAATKDDPAVTPIAEALASRSPTSLEATRQALLDARLRPNVGDVLARDLRLATLVAALPDFAEGVRAVLVDKDRSPKWNPAAFESVPADRIAAAIAGSVAAPAQASVSTS